MKRLITIVGPTASGKTTLAVALARKIGGEILSADSRQVYRGMDIGTGKDLSEYGSIPYHLIDICAVGEKYNLFRFQEDFLIALREVHRHDAYPIFCGGSGLYVESILKGYRLPLAPQNPELRTSLEGKTLSELADILSQLKRKNGHSMHNTTDIDTAQRAIRAIEIELSMVPNTTTPPAIESFPLVFGIDISRQQRRERITRRLEERLDEGMIREVEGLLHRGIPPEDLIYYGLEYKYVTEYCIGLRTYEDMVHSLEVAIHQFAKRQMTWFRGMERRGTPIHWLAFDRSTEEKVEEIISTMKEKND